MSNELVVTDIVLGEGKECVKGALITAHYTGWLLDGTKFDSSVDRGQPFQCVIVSAHMHRQPLLKMPRWCWRLIRRWWGFQQRHPVSWMLSKLQLIYGPNDRK